MGNALDALGIVDGLCEDVGLDVGTGGIVAVQHGLGLLGQLHGHLDLGGAVGGDIDGGNAGLLGQQDVGIVGGDPAVAVDIAVGLQLQAVIQQVLQQVGGIVGIGDAVAVEVALEAILNTLQGHAVAGELDLGGQIPGPGIQVQIAVVITEDILGEQIGGQDVGHGLTADVVDLELHIVLAGTVGIVAQLGLDLAVVLTPDGDVALGGGSQVHAAQAGTLVQQGVVLTAGSGLAHGNCGGHQQALGQMTDTHAGLLVQVVGLDVLSHQSGHAGDLGGGHGGTGHHLVLGAGGIHTVDGPDVAAGGGDLRLQLQGAGGAPGGEDGHGVILRAVHGAAQLAADGDGTGVVGQAVGGGLPGGSGPDGVAVTLHDGNTGSRIGIVGQVHAEGLIHIVADDDGGGTQLGGVVALLEEGDLAAVAEDDLAGQVQTGVILGLTDAVDEDIFIIGALAGGIQGGDGAVAVLGLGVDDHVAAHGDVLAHGAVVIHGGDGEGVGQRSGRAVGLEGDAVVVQIAGGGLLGPVAGVAGGHDDHGIGGGHVLQQVGEQIVLAVAGGAGAQGQVNAVTAQPDGILDGGEVVGIVGTGVVAEDLQGDELGIGGHAAHADHVTGVLIGSTGVDVAVGGGDAGHVGAVGALVIPVVVDGQVVVHVVGTEGQLLGHVVLGSVALTDALVGVQVLQNGFDLLGIQQVQGSHVGFGGHALFGSVLRQGIQVGTVVEGLVIGVRAGIDDGDPGACAGHAGLPDGGAAGHGGGAVGIGLRSLDLIGPLQDHVPDALDRLDGVELAVGHIGGNDVADQGQVPDNVQLPAAQGLGGDDLGHAVLVLLQLQVVGHCIGIGADAHGGIAHFQGRCVLQNDGHTHHVGGLVGSLAVELILEKPVRLIPGHIHIGLFPAQAHGISMDGGEHTQNHHSCQDQAEKPVEQMLSHN